MTTISLCMIVNNNTETLETCLNSIKDLVDEIIIVDTGSTDNTKEIIKDYTSYIYDYNATNNADAKNYCFSKATKDYIMWINPNEYLTDLNRKYFKEFKAKLKINYDAIMMKNELSFDNNGRCNQWNFSERLVKRSKNFLWQGDIHEFLVIMGSITYSDIAIQRISTKKKIKKIQTKKFDKSKTTSEHPKNMLKYAKEHFNSDDIVESINWLNKFVASDIENINERVEANLLLADCHKLNQDEISRVKILINTLSLDIIHPEIYYSMGNYYFDHDNLYTAIVWYKAVIECKNIIDTKQTNIKDILLKSYIGICECYKKLNNDDKALIFHKKAKRLNSKDIKVIDNENYFNAIKEETTV